MTVRELIAQRPARSRILAQLGVDYWCGGQLTLYQACARRGLDAVSVLLTLEATESLDRRLDLSADLLSMTLAELCDHIERTHHRFLKTELPRLVRLGQALHERYGQRFPWVVDVGERLQDLAKSLSAHLRQEEKLLFPAIRDLETRPVSKSATREEGLLNRWGQEHKSLAEALWQIRQLAHGFQAPAGGCEELRRWLRGLSDLESDLHEHISTENNLLFPRVLQRLPSKASA